MNNLQIIGILIVLAGLCAIGLYINFILMDIDKQEEQIEKDIGWWNNDNSL